MHSFRQFFFLLPALLVFSMGCEQIDDLSGGADTPTVTYPSTTLEATFYQAGSSSAPTLAWNGDQGTITLGGTPVEGLSVNSTTGQLQWTKLLPPGTHQVDVIVSNSEGQVVVPMTVENPLAGTFTGTYSNTDYFSFDLNADGTVAVRANNASIPDEATGTWTLDGDEVKAVYTYDGDYSYSFGGTLGQTATKASIMGKWYYDDSFDAAQEGGSVEVDYE
jgi:hypothetical protein